MILALVLLAQTTAATPAPVATPAPSPAPARVKFTGGFGRVATAPARKVTIGPDDVKAAPTPEPESFVPGFVKPTPPAAATSAAPATAPAAPPAQNEVAWRMRYSNVRGDLKRAETDMVRARQNAVVSGYVGDQAAVDATIKQALAPYQAEIDRAKKAVKALQDECATTPGCSEAWVRD